MLHEYAHSLRKFNIEMINKAMLMYFNGRSLWSVREKINGLDKNLFKKMMF